MPEFLQLLPPSKALAKLLAALPARTGVPKEKVPTSEALGRVLAQAVRAPSPLPPFTRSSVDGYALRAADTYGATPSLPSYLKLVGEVLMGKPTSLKLTQGEAALVHTGSMLPGGGDAVVMVEDTQRTTDGEIEVLKPVASGQNVLLEGEDVKAGEQVMSSGMPMRPQEIGALLALGLTEIEVARRPRVGILSTGDEIVPPEHELSAGQIRDINSFTLSALVEKAGGQPVRRGIIPDSFEELKAAAERSHTEDDIVVITAGSSVSARDITSRVVESLGKPGVLVHGVSVKPGKPTILAVAGNVPIIGLPGNPVSALVVAALFVVPLIRHLLGTTVKPFEASVLARLATNTPSETGREDYVPVSLESSSQGLLAHPVFGASNLILTLVRADGLVRIPPETTGLAAGELVDVWLF